MGSSIELKYQKSIKMGSWEILGVVTFNSQLKMRQDYMCWKYIFKEEHNGKLKFGKWTSSYSKIIA